MMSPVIPVKQFAETGDTLLRWMGMFWTTLYRDPEYLRALQQGRGLLAAQAYLNLLEAAQLLDRRAAPVLHRERWYPIVVRRSQRNTSGTTLRLGMEPTPVLGPQTMSAFRSGTVFKLGGAAAFAGLVTYPMAPGPVRVATCIVDNITAPATILVRDKDFTVQNGVLVIRASDDPFDGGVPFPADNVMTDGQEDLETVMWGCDVMFDQNYVNDHIGYVLGVRVDDDEYNKRLLNAVWDLITSGVSPKLLAGALGALFDVPTVLEDGEIVETLANADNASLVITDKNVYRLPLNAVLAADVYPGALLYAGDFLDTSIHVYAGVTDPAASRYPTLRQDIPAVSLPAALFQAPLQHGLSVDWAPAPIYYDGDDANGNPRLWFPLTGTEADVRAFWAEAWAACAAAGTSIETCFAGYINGIVSRRQGAVCGYVKPLDFFLRNLIGANTVLVSVDTAQLRPRARQRMSSLFVRMVNEALPATLRLFLIERVTAPRVTYSVHDNIADVIVAKYVTQDHYSSGRPGRPTPAGLTFNDRRIATRWVASCDKE